MIFYERKKRMIKQKILTLFWSFLPFGTGMTFWLGFGKKTTGFLSGTIIALHLLAILICGFFPKIRKDILEKAIKLQPLAAVVFTASFVLSFLPYSMMWLQLFAVLVLNTVCLCMAFENLETFGLKMFFGFLGAGALIGMGIGLSGRTGLLYLCFVMLSLLCRPKGAERTAQDIWKDVAFPLFVLVGAFVLFIAANHGGAFPELIAQSAVMLMTGGLLMTSASSLRLTLMTIVMMVFGSYVFSTQNPDSVFNRSGKPLTQIERLF